MLVVLPGGASTHATPHSQNTTLPSSLHTPRSPTILVSPFHPSTGFFIACTWARPISMTFIARYQFLPEQKSATFKQTKRTNLCLFRLTSFLICINQDACVQIKCLDVYRCIEMNLYIYVHVFLAAFHHSLSRSRYIRAFVMDQRQ